MGSAISSISNQGVLATNSGNNTSFASLSTSQLTQPGTYRITAYVSLYGTAPTSADANNVKLVVGGSSQILPIPASAGAGSPYSFTVELDGATAISLQSATAGPSVATYSGMLVAEYLGRNGNLARYR
jgi:hypothetical protein